MSTSARRRIGPETWSGRAGGREAGFWLRADLVEQDNQALRQERDGLIERIKERIAGIYRSFRRSRGRLVKRSFFETTWRRRWRHEISGLNWRNRPATTVQPEHGPRPQLALVYRIQQAPGHFMDNEDTRVPTVHIESGGAYHRRHAAGTLGRPHGQYRPGCSPPAHQLAHHPKSLVYRIQQAPGYLYGQ